MSLVPMAIGHSVRFGSYWKKMTKHFVKDLRPLLSKHITKCIQYNVPDGKKNRGYSVPATFRLLANKQDLTKENIR